MPLAHANAPQNFIQDTLEEKALYEHRYFDSEPLRSTLQLHLPETLSNLVIEYESDYLFLAKKQYALERKKIKQAAPEKELALQKYKRSCLDRLNVLKRKARSTVATTLTNIWLWMPRKPWSY